MCQLYYLHNESLIIILATANKHQQYTVYNCIQPYCPQVHPKRPPYDPTYEAIYGLEASQVATLAGVQSSLFTHHTTLQEQERANTYNIH